MITRYTVRAAATARCAAALFLGLAPVTVARSLTVDAAPCARKIHVRAQDVPLGEVIKAVAGALQIRLEARTQLTDVVSFSGSGTPEQILQQLMLGHNIVLDSQPTRRCGGRDVLTTAWVLPAGQGSPPPAVAAPQARQPADAKLQPLRPPRPRGTHQRMSEAEWQKMKEDYMAGKIQADPETGLPVPVEPGPSAEKK